MMEKYLFTTKLNKNSGWPQITLNYVEWSIGLEKDLNKRIEVSIDDVDVILLNKISNVEFNLKIIGHGALLYELILSGPIREEKLKILLELFREAKKRGRPSFLPLELEEYKDLSGASAYTGFKTKLSPIVLVVPSISFLIVFVILVYMSLENTQTTTPYSNEDHISKIRQVETLSEEDQLILEARKYLDENNTYSSNNTLNRLKKNFPNSKYKSEIEDLKKVIRLRFDIENKKAQEHSLKNQIKKKESDSVMQTNKFKKELTWETSGLKCKQAGKVKNVWINTDHGTYTLNGQAASWVQKAESLGSPLIGVDGKKWKNASDYLPPIKVHQLIEAGLKVCK